MENAMMHDLTLIYPPQWSPFQPALSIPTLLGWLRKEGYAVNSIDANIDFYHYLLSDEVSNILLDEVSKNKEIEEGEKGAIRAVLSSSAQIRATIKKMFDSSDTTSAGKDSSLQNSYLATRILTSYLNTISLFTKPISITPFGLDISSKDGMRVSDYEDIIDNQPVIIRKFIDSILNNPAVQSANLIGLSCIGYSQLLMTFILGKAIKEKTGKTVIVGGTILSRLLDRASIPNHWFDDYFDIVVKQEGEVPCSIMLKNQQASRPLTKDVPNIYYLESGEIHFNHDLAKAINFEKDDIDPDFSDLDLTAYFSPEITLPILSSRGCYWGKCEFCTHSEVYGGKFKYVKAKNLLARIERLSKKHGVTNFCFNDEAIPPRLLRDMGNIFPSKNQSGWAFSGIMRFEESFSESLFKNLHNKGFLVMYVGLESASEHVLSLMNKACKPSKGTILRNLIAASNSGIFVNCFTFFGFPGETENEAKETYEFVINNSKYIGSFGTGNFLLEYGSPIYNDPEPHGLTIHEPDEGDLSIWHKYKPSYGMSSAEAEAWSEKLTIDAHKLEDYASSVFSQREHLLPLLKKYSKTYECETKKLFLLDGIPDRITANDAIILTATNSKVNEEMYALNISNGAVNQIAKSAYELMQEYFTINPSLHDVSELSNKWKKFVQMQA